MALKTIRKKILVGGFDRKIAQKLMKKLESTGFSAGLTEKKGCLAGEHKKRKDKSFGISPLLSFLFWFINFSCCNINFPSLGHVMECMRY
ncbi:poly-gamma-glutamate hydrolase family protein [Bacillus subtilis]|uniref:poly-gamma-glutamate hydrolase family protein n=2 Tax=Bacillus subtilis TaxID=1423 RepID=UPI0010C078B0|nr:poly-gamma-glutamate hydrolase family protein [Bacillus subtilis]NJI53151.1 hypothetical protein [Bacillus subtilis]